VLSTRGLRVRLFAGGSATRLLQGLQLTVDEERAPILPGPASLLRLGRRALQDRRALAAAPPKLVLSDGDQASLLAARSLALPAVALGHDQVFRSGVAHGSLPGWALAAQRLNQAPTLVATRAIAVHFLPVTSSVEGLVIARPEPQFAAKPGAAGSSGKILCYFRDANGASVVRRLAALGQEVVVYGPAMPALPTEVQRRDFDPAGFRAELLTCRAVIASAGSNLLAECVLLGKPILALYRQADSEQRLNAFMAARAHVAEAALFGEAEQTLKRFLARVERGDFARIDLAAALPPLSAALAATLDTLEL